MNDRHDAVGGKNCLAKAAKVTKEPKADQSGIFFTNSRILQVEKMIFHLRLPRLLRETSFSFLE
jgi:hypothetical protein